MPQFPLLLSGTSDSLNQYLPKSWILDLGGEEAILLSVPAQTQSVSIVATCVLPLSQLPGWGPANRRLLSQGLFSLYFFLQLIVNVSTYGTGFPLLTGISNFLVKLKHENTNNTRDKWRQMSLRGSHGIEALGFGQDCVSEAVRVCWVLPQNFSPKLNQETIR